MGNSQDRLEGNNRNVSRACAFGASTSLATGVVALLAASLIGTSPAVADGGRGGANNFETGAGPYGGAGGTGYNGQSGFSGTADPDGTGGGGGGAGGGAGGNGGAGQNGAAGYAGGAGGNASHPNGYDGVSEPDPNNPNGPGGGGGGGGINGFIGAQLPSAAGNASTGGDGGSGGFSTSGGGGGGGAGGYGAVVTGSGLNTNNGSSAGGNGGTGGATEQGGGSSAFPGRTFQPGGGGGGDGGVGATFSASGVAVTNAGSFTGGNGGIGGSGNVGVQAGDGGYGGQGGAGVSFGSSFTLTNQGGTSIAGGNGGTGGSGGSTANTDNPRNGNGGQGGVGVVGSGGTITNAGMITGGKGGAAGTGAAIAGTAGTGGVGIAGSNLTVVNSGTISGGLANNGAGIQADALSFSGGTNMLTLSSGGTTGTLNGNIGITGALTIDPGTAAGTSVTLGNTIHDVTTAGSIIKAGAGTLDLTATNTYSGGTTITAGTLVAGHATGANVDALGGGLITFNGGTLSNGTGFNATLTNAIQLNAAGGTVKDGGTGFILNGNITGTGGITVSPTNFVSFGGNNTYSGATAITSGTLYSISNTALSGNSAFLVATGATLNLNTTANTIGSLSDAVPGAGGTVTTGQNATLTIGQDDTSTTFSGQIAQSPVGQLALTKIGIGTLTLAGTNTYTGGTTINAGTLEVRGGAALADTGAVTLANVANATLLVTNSETIGSLAGGGTTGGAVSIASGQTLTTGASNASTQFNGQIGGAGSLTKVGTGQFTIAGTLATSGTTIVNGGLLRIGVDGGTQGTISGSVVNNSFLDFTTANVTGLTNITTNAAGLTQFYGPITGLSATITNAGSTTFRRTTSAGNATIVNTAGTTSFIANSTGGQASFNALGGTIDFSATTGPAGDGQITAGSIAGAAAGSYNLGSNTLTSGSNNASTSVAGVISGSGGSLVKAGTGAMTLAGANTYTGTTTISGGTLNVTGSIAASSLTTVNANAMLTGTGTVGATQVNTGGIFMPGNGTPGTSMTVGGSLAFQSGALYLVQVNPTTASQANVAGTATLGGATVNAAYANGSYISKQYTILTAAAGVSGQFGSLVNTNLPSNFTSSLSYDATHAYLNLALYAGPSFPGGLNQNQRAVANALTNFFNTTGGIPAVFGTLSPAGLTQVSGEAASGSQQTTFDAMNQFIGVMTDPFIAGRGDGAAFGGNATGYADEALGYGQTRKPNDALAAIYTKAPPRVPSFEQRWSTWVAGYGGSQTTDGNTTLGSNNTTSSVYGTAVGADYRFSPNTLAGFAIAGGGTSFSVANGGSGHSDLFQAGAFIRHNEGPAYISAALAYGWQDVTTNRSVAVAGIDQYQARFNANAYSGRLEGGYRYVTPYFGGLGITPYAAGQSTTFDLPGYAEGVLSGAGTFALGYNAKSVTDTRSELGLRTDKSFAVQGGILTLRGRAAWAHDYDPDRSIAATFQTLPGASFMVNGAAQAHDSALTTASAEMKWTNGWSAAATFEGEFSDVTRSYAGKGLVRYVW